MPPKPKRARTTSGTEEDAAATAAATQPTATPGSAGGGADHAPADADGGPSHAGAYSRQHLVRRASLFNPYSRPHPKARRRPKRTISVPESGLTQYPTKIFAMEPEDQLNLGDLHGNVLKLIFVLISRGILSISKENEEDYASLVKIYEKMPTSVKTCKSFTGPPAFTMAPLGEILPELQTAPPLAPQDIALFRDILNRITVKPIAVLRLIGDEFADRGHSDYLMILLFVLLKLSGQTIECVLSNHTAELLRYLEDPSKFSDNRSIPPCQRSSKFRFQDDKSIPLFQRLSMCGLLALTDDPAFNVTREEVRELFREYYLPCLKLISYTLNPEENEITIYSHAPIGLETIRRLVDYFNDEIPPPQNCPPFTKRLEYHAATAKELADTIRAINERFDLYKNAGEIHTLLPNISDSTNPVQNVLWQRDTRFLDRPLTLTPGGDKVFFNHGHDGNAPEAENVDNLDKDNDLGKGMKGGKGRPLRMMSAAGCPDSTAATPQPS